MIAPCPGFELIHGFELAGRNVLGEILDRGHVLGDEVLDGGTAHARRIVKLFPRAAASVMSARDEEARNHAVGDALTGIAGCHEDVLAAGIAADEAGVVDRVHDLARPAMRFAAELRHEPPDPGLQIPQTAPRRHPPRRSCDRRRRRSDTPSRRARLQADIVIGIERVPVERVGQSPRGS